VFQAAPANRERPEKLEKTARRAKFQKTPRMATEDHKAFLETRENLVKIRGLLSVETAQQKKKPKTKVFHTDLMSSMKS